MFFSSSPRSRENEWSKKLPFSLRDRFAALIRVSAAAAAEGLGGGDDDGMLAAPGATSSVLVCWFSDDAVESEE
jgi:hypothetical protein